MSLCPHGLGIRYGVILNFAVHDLLSSLRVIVTGVDAFTVDVVILKVAVVAPSATVALAGTPALELLAVSAPHIPPAGAGPAKVTVPVNEVPPATVFVESFKLTNRSGVMVTFAVFDELPDLAVIVFVKSEPTAIVVTLNVAALSPAATVTLAGGVAAFPLDASVTTTPPAGASPLRVTVPVGEVPAITEDGVIVSPVRAGGLTVSIADLKVGLTVAVTDTEV